MAAQNYLRKVTDGDQINEGYLNGLADAAFSTAIVSHINNTNTHEDRYIHSDDLTTDSATTKTNWTYDATNDLYYNEQTSAATLEWQNILSQWQKSHLTSETKSVLLLVDYTPTGDVESGGTTVSNYSFETAGAGGADVFGSWTETAGGGTYAQSTSNVTEGTYTAQYTTPGDTGNYTGTLTQSIDVTNVNYISMDYHIEATCTSNTIMVCTTKLDVGGLNVQASVTQNGTGGPNTDTGTLVLDVSSLTGSQTITLTSTKVRTGGLGTGTCTTYNDNLKTWSLATTANTTTTFSVSPNGSTAYETVSNGQIATLSSAITDLGVKIVETNTDAETGVYSTVKNFGVFFK